MIKTILSALLVGTACIAMTPTAHAAASDTSATVSRDTKSTFPFAATPRYRGGKGNRFKKLHEQFVERTKQGPVDLLFMGDSITDRWRQVPEVWEANFGKWHPANFGIGGDRTEGVLWRITHGELDGIRPRVMVLMIGTNNTHSDSPEDIVTGIKRIIEITHEKLPETKILLLAVFPREPRTVDGKLDMEPINKIKVINKELPKLAEKDYVRFLDISDKFRVDGKVPADIMPDQVHPSKKGYEIWAKAIMPVLSEMMKEEGKQP